MGSASSARIKELPGHERPRERLQASGPAALADSELLAIFIRTGTKNRNAIQVGAELLRAHGSLDRLARCTPKELASSASGVGLAKATELCAAFELGRRLARGRDLRPLLDTPSSIYEHLAQDMQALHVESLRVGLLDTKRRLIRFEEVTRGLVNESLAHPREVFRPALIHAASAVVLVHNHPSGDPTPSEADRRVTRQLRSAAEILQITLVDHVIVGSAEGGKMPYFSFREAGWI